MNRVEVMMSFVFLMFFGICSGQVDSIAEKDTLLNEQVLEQLSEQTITGDVSRIDIESSLESRETKSYLNIRSRVSQTLIPTAGYQRGVYLGSRLKSYQRLKFIAGDHFSGGILFEKDAGEQRLNNFMSGNLTVKDVGIISKLVIGDYIIEVGQGICLWRGYDFSKGADVISPINRKAGGLISYTSSDENSFFRGVACEFNIGSSTFDIFYSKRFRSAYLDDLNQITSFNSYGYYRTQNEIEIYNNIKESVYGFRSIYRFTDNNMIGITAYQSKFSKPLSFDSGKKFSGSDYSMASIDYKFQINTVELFGEWGSIKNTIGGNSGIFLKPTDTFKMIAAFRYYPYDFTTLHGFGFGERTTTSNECGQYLGISLKLLHWLSISSYYDQFKSLEPLTNSLFPGSGQDILSQVIINPYKRIEIAIRYQRKIVEETTTIKNSFGFLVEQTDIRNKQNIRLNLDYQLSRNVKLRTRFEKLLIDTKLTKRLEQGWIAYQDISNKYSETFSWNLRLIYFRTDSYDSRLYEYERDLQGVFSLPALFGSGIRWYLLLKYKIWNNVELSAKYSDLIRDDVKRIGTGLDQFPHNHDNRIGIQLDFRL